MKNIFFKSTLLLLISLFYIGFTFKGKPELKTYVELKNLSEKIANKRYTSKVNIYLYDDLSSKTPIEIKQMEMTTWDQFMHYKTEFMEAFTNNEMMVSINHKNKIILINKNLFNKKNSQANSLLPFALDTNINKMYKISVFNNETAQKTFVLTNQIDGNSISKMLFKIDTKQIKPMSCEIFYAEELDQLVGKIKPKKENKKPRLLMDFAVFEYNTKFNADQFKFNDILISMNNKNFKLTEKYKDYELHNNLLSYKRK